MRGVPHVLGDMEANQGTQPQHPPSFPYSMLPHERRRHRAGRAGLHPELLQRVLDRLHAVLLDLICDAIKNLVQFLRNEKIQFVYTCVNWKGVDNENAYAILRNPSGSGVCLVLFYIFVFM